MASAFARLQKRLNVHFYTLHRNKKDVLGVTHPYSTWPGLPWPQETPEGKASGSINFFPDLDAIERYADWLDKLNSWRAEDDGKSPVSDPGV